MKKCINCGMQNEDQSNFCVSCGSSDFSNDNEQSVQNLNYQAQGQGYPPVYTPEQPIVQHPMKWFKFLIYFALFFGAFANLVLGLNYISGGIYPVQTNGQVTADMVYGFYGGGLKTLDVFYGVIMVAIAGFGIFTRFRLSKYKADGPKCVYIIYASGAVSTLIYNIALFAVNGLNQIFTVSSITSLVVSALFVFLNYRYFTKRKELFNN